MASVKEVYAHVRNEEHDRAAIVCQKILAADNDDGDAFKTALIGWINANKAHLAVKVIDNYPSLAASYPFTTGYALYRAGLYDRAADAVSRSGDQSGRSGPLAFLDAQLRYRQCDYAGSLARYDALLDSGSVPVTTELIANASAAGVAGRDPRGALSVLYGESAADDLVAKSTSGSGASDAAGALTEAAGAYELMYNAACAFIALGDAGAALGKLEAGSAACRERLAEEDFAEDEIEDEVAIIEAQRALALQLLGRTDEARDVFAGEGIKAASDKTVAAVADVNAAMLRGRDADPLEALRATTAASANELQAKLTAEQRQAIHFNRAMFMVLANKPAADVVNQIERRLEPACGGGSGAEDLPVLVRASVLYRDRDYDGAAEALGAYAKRHPDAVAPRLALAQLRHLGGNPAAAADAVDAVESIRGTPGAAVTVSALREKAGDIEGALAALDAAAKAQDASGDAEARRIKLGLMRRAGDVLLRAGDNEAAAERFRAVLAENKRDADALPRLVLATAETDLAAAEKAAKSLMDPPEPKEDVDTLERTPSLAKASHGHAPSELASAAASAPGAAAVSGAAGSASAGAGAGASEQAAGSQAAGSADVAAPMVDGVNADGLSLAQIQARRDRQKKRKRKPKYPQGFNPEDPGNSPYDGSRWLPKWERLKSKAGYKGKKMKGTRGAQGLAPADAREIDKLDRSLDTAADAAAPKEQGKSAGNVVKGNGGGGGGGKNKKKGKKRK